MAFLENCSVIPRKTAVVKPMPTKKDKTASWDGALQYDMYKCQNKSVQRWKADKTEIWT